MKNLNYLIVLLLAYSTYAQDDLVVSGYTWEEKPSFDLNIDSEEPMKALKEHYITEFAYAPDNSFIEYYLEHKAYWLNSNDKIEDFNKIYLPYASNSVLMRSKARVITKSGKIINLDDSKILSAQDEETGKQYKYFAFEGVEQGSVIEYFYVEKKTPSYSGTAFRLQSDFEKEQVGFDLYSPSNLVFKFKSYNGLPEVERDTLSKDRLHWRLHIPKIQKLPLEEQSAYAASRGYLVYKLDRNLKTNKSDLSSYGTVAQNIYNYYCADPSKKAAIQIQDFISSNVGNIDDMEAKIRELDRIIKSSFIKSESGGDNLKDLEEVLEKKVASSTGLIKLYVALFRQLGEKHEIVITSDREVLKFDKEFEAQNYLTNFLIYFPGFDTYVSPTDMQSLYGYPPAFLTDNYGLFIKEVSIGSFKSGIGKIKYIKPLDAGNAVDKMVIDVQFDEADITSNKIKLERSFSGYYAMPIHPYMSLVVGKDREDMIEGLAKTMNENVVVEKQKVHNEDPKLFGVEPLTFEIDITSDAFVEKAGNKYLFKIGELIGPQMEMYQEKERVLPLENEHQRSYFRNININIPKGYKIANLADLNIDNKFEQDGKELFSFVSYYEVKDNVLHITADEHYRINIITPSIFEEYRKVINTAADFNKITLILEPAG
nr:DUF3857 domain-containing protein [Allomuricauda sp.]